MEFKINIYIFFIVKLNLLNKKYTKNEYVKMMIKPVNHKKRLSVKIKKKKMDLNKTIDFFNI